MNNEQKPYDFVQLGQRIRSARIAQGMSQADLASKANISLPSINPIETGKSKMQLLTFIRIIESLQISADQVLQADVPAVIRNVYASEISELLEDCTPAEAESLFNILKNLKTSLRNQSNNQ